MREFAMFRSILTAVCSLLVLAACGSCAPRHVPDQLPTLARPSIGRLVVLDSAGEVRTRCTVWKLDDRLAITAGHCCMEDHHYTIQEAGVPGDQITVLHDNDKMDICVMRARMVGAPAPLAPNDPPIGARVWSAGFPHGHFMIGDGYWSGRNDEGRGSFSIDGSGGFSGGPVMDSSGRVVSVLIEGYLGRSTTFGVPLEQIRIAISAARIADMETPED